MKNRREVTSKKTDEYFSDDHIYFADDGYVGFSVASTALLALVPGLALMQGTFLYRLIMLAFKLCLLPLVVGITYEINRMVGRYDNWFTHALSAPGLWMQNFTTNEPEDSMIEVGIAAVQAVLPEEEGADRW